MPRTPSPNETSARPTSQARFATWAAVIAIVMGLAVNTLSATQLIRERPAYDAAQSAVMSVWFGYTVICSIAFWLGRRGHPLWAVRLLLSGLMLAGLGTVALASGMGPVIAVSVMLLSTITVMLTQMPQGEAQWSAIISIVVGALALWIDVAGPGYRLPVPEVFKTAGAIIASVHVLTLGLLTLGQFRRLSLQTKLIFASLAVSIIPLAVLGYISDLVTRRALVNAANESLASAAAQTAFELDEFIQSNLDATRTEAQLPAFGEFLEMSAQPQAASPHTSKATVEIGNMLLALSRRDQLYILSYALLDESGIGVVDTYSPDIGLDQSDRDYFRTPVATGLPYVSPVKVSEAGDRSSIYFSAPVRNVEGRIVGVLRIRYNATILQQIVANANGLAGKGSFAVLLDENHIRLADSSVPELNLKTVVPLDPAKVATLQAAHRLPRKPVEQLSTNLPNLEQGLTNIAVQPFFRAELHQADTDLEAAAAAPLTTEPWLVVFAQTEEAFLAPVETQTRNALLIGAMITALVMMAAALVALQLTGPIIRLTAAAEKVGAGDLDAQVQSEADDEIGRLAATFNTMTAQLRRTLGGLAERTQELKKVNQQLLLELEERQQAEAKFRTLVEQVPAVTYIASLDEAGETLYVSPQIEDVLGFTPAEWMADPELWRKQLHPDDRERVLAADEYSHATGEPFTAEYRIFARDGRVVWFHDESRWVRDENGQPRFTQGIELDITKRKREALLREIVYQVLRAVSGQLDVDLVARSAVETIVKLIGYPHVCLALPNQNGTHWVVRGAAGSLAAELGATYPIHQGVIGRAFKSGQTQWVRNILNDPAYVRDVSAADAPALQSEVVTLMRRGDHLLGALNVESDRVDAFEVDDVMMMQSLADVIALALENARLYGEAQREIAERKQIEGALRESEQRYELAVRGANDGLWDWDLNTDYIYYSPRWKSMLGYEDRESDHSPDDWLKRIHPDDLLHVKADLTSHLEGNTDYFESEYRMSHADSSYRWILSRGLAVRDASGRAYRMAGSQTDITARKQAEERLAHDALHDGLTGLPNRTLFLDRLEHSIKRTKRPGDKKYLFAVLFLDIDRFKLVNDSLGHALGDQLLIKITERLQKCLRPADTVARLGGDEFTILLEGVVDAADATRIAERVQKELSTPFRLDGHQISTTASIGIAMSGTGYDRAEDLLRDADTAMYRAKNLGKARHEIFDAGMHAAVSSLLQMEADLRQAIEKQEFQVYYQPLVSLASGRIVGTEALLRWQHPRRGLLPPAAFISVLEETGMIVQVGEWILRAACIQNKVWQDNGYPYLRVAVNFSARQFQIKNLARLVKNVLDETRMDPKTLELEITESTAMKDTKLTIKTLNELHALGVGISLDDFGSSYSALGYLKRFPFQKLKADRSFIMDIPNDANDAAITAAIIAMAHSLKLRVVAEGVETAQQLAFLRSQHCDEVQGFLFSHPVPAEELFTLLRKKRLLSKSKTKASASPSSKG